MPEPPSVNVRLAVLVIRELMVIPPVPLMSTMFSVAFPRPTAMVELAAEPPVLFRRVRVAPLALAMMTLETEFTVPPTRLKVAVLALELFPMENEVSWPLVRLIAW